MTQDSASKHSLYLPRYWPNYFGFLCVRLISWLPYPILYRLGEFAGLFLFHFAKSRVRIAQANIQKCFPDLNPDEQAAQVREVLIATGIGMMETAMLWFGPKRNLKKYLKIEGLEHYQKAINDGKGVLILGFHLTSLEVAGSLLGQVFPLAALYRQNENPVIEKAMVKGRGKYVHTIPRTNTRDMIRWIKKNGAVWYAADQDYGRKQSLFVPFFDIPTATITATSRFAKLTGAPVIPFTHQRIGKGKGISITLHKPLAIDGNNPEQEATEINRFLESYLKRYPTDYLWVHRRFKTRPNENHPSFYPAKINKRPLTAERYKNLIESAITIIEGQPEKPIRLLTKDFLVYFFYREKGWKDTLFPPFKRELGNLKQVEFEEQLFLFRGAVRYCELKNCDIVYLHRQ